MGPLCNLPIRAAGQKIAASIFLLITPNSLFVAGALLPRPRWDGSGVRAFEPDFFS